MFFYLYVFFCGKINFLLLGDWSHRFLRLCAVNNIEIYDLKTENGGYTGYMILRDYRRARKLARKSRVSLTIRKKQGFPFVLYRNRKRKAWVFGLLMAVSLLYTSTHYLWDIEFRGNMYYTDDILMDTLKCNDVNYGMKISELVCDELEQNIRNIYPQITWVSAQIEGTRLVVSVKEEPEQKDEEVYSGPSDIVAAADGIITDIVTRSGIPLVKAGDEVKKGQVLVSGKIPIKNDASEITGIREVAADAVIRGITDIKYHWKTSLLIEEKNISARKFNGLMIKLGNAIFDIKPDIFPGDSLFGTEEPYGRYIVKEYSDLKILNGFTLPIGLETEYEYYYDVMVRPMNMEEQHSAADAGFKEYIQSLEQEDKLLVSSDIDIYNDNLFLYADGMTVFEIPMGKVIAGTQKNGELGE